MDTPPQDEMDAPPPPQTLNPVYANYLPADLRYDADFDNAVMSTILSDWSPRLDCKRPSRASLDGSLYIPQDELPIPLNDHRRIYHSREPRIALTHRGGFFEGGPGLDPEMDTFTQDFLAAHDHSSSPAELRDAVDRAIASSKHDLRQRMLARQKAMEKNEQIERDLERMREAHRMERKIQQRQAEERRTRKEAKERRRQERDAVG